MAEPIARPAGAESPSPEAEIGHRIRAGSQQAIAEAKSMVWDMADTQRRKVADALGGMAQALHRSAKDITTENKSMGHYTDMAAERLDQVARYMRQAHWNDIVDGAEDFARRQPWVFLGGAVAAGFALGRLFKGSAPPAAESEEGREEMAEAEIESLSSSVAAVNPPSPAGGAS